MTAMRSMRLAMSWVVVLWLWGIVTPTPARAEAQRYERQVLFGPSYGAGENQIGAAPGRDHEAAAAPASLSALQVPAEDMIFVVDAVQGRVKGFNAAGELVVLAGSRYEKLDVEGQPEVVRRLGMVHDFAATPQGRFYAAVGGAVVGVQAFDEWGVPQPGSRESSAAQILENVCRTYGMYRPPNVFTVEADQYGFVYLHVGPAPVQYNVVLAKFDADMSFVGVVPGFMVGWDGRTYGFVPNKGSEPNDRLLVWAPDGTLEGAIRLRPPAGVAEGDYDYARGIWRAVSGVLFDGQGDVYMVYRVRQPRDTWIELSPDFKIREDIVVYKFDHQGTFLLRLELRGLPFYMHPPIAVDPAGNIYHLEYYQDRVDFVKEVLVVVAGTGER